MDLYFLDADFMPLTGPADGCSSIVWSERYFENGSFTLHFPKELLPSVYDAVYVRTGVENGRIKCGRITYVLTDDEEEAGGCEMGGKMLESLLDDRVLAGKGCSSGPLTQAVVSAVEANLRFCGVEIGESEWIDDAVSLTYEWDTLSEWLYAVLRPFGASYRIELDPERNVPVFRIVRGIDRSSGVGQNLSENYNLGQAVFSSSFGNIVSIRFERDTAEVKNVVYVEGSDGTVVEVDRSGGAPKREMYKAVTDVKPSDFAGTAAYTAALRQRGAEILANYTEIYHISAEADAGVSLVYGTDYALGDICDVADDALGLSFGMRLTAVDDVTEYGTRTLYPSFGEEVRQVRRLLGGKRY